jgi:hypothetical protein
VGPSLPIIDRFPCLLFNASPSGIRKISHGLMIGDRRETLHRLAPGYNPSSVLLPTSSTTANPGGLNPDKTNTSTSIIEPIQPTKTLNPTEELAMQLEDLNRGL